MIKTIKLKFSALFFNWKTFLLFNFIILLVKIAISYSQGFAIGFFEDWRIAENLALHGSYSWQIEFGSSAFKLPIYPLFLFFFIKVFGSIAAIKWILFLQHIIYFCIPILMVKCFNNFKLLNVGFLSGYFFIFSPSYFYYSSVLEATNLFILFFLLWFYFYSFLWNNNTSQKKVIFLLIMTGLLALTQVVVIPIMLFLIILLYIYKKTKISTIALIFFIAGILYSPWIIRNYVVFNKIIISKTPVWQNVYMGYISEHQIFKKNVFLSEVEEKKVLDQIPLHDEFENEKMYKKVVETIQKRHSYAALKKALNNFVSLWYVPNRYFYDNSWSILLGRKLYVLVLDVFLCMGLYYFFKKKFYKILLFSSIILAGFTVPYLIGHAANIRFKLDFEWIQTSIIAFYIMMIGKEKCTIQNPDFD